MAVIRIEGVEFEREDAREFYERVVVYFEAGPPSPGNSETQRAVRLAGQIYACLRGKGPCDVTLRTAEATTFSSRRFVLYGAAQESNLPSRGLHDRTGFEDQLGHRAHAAPWFDRSAEAEALCRAGA